MEKVKGKHTARVRLKMEPALDSIHGRASMPTKP